MTTFLMILGAVVIGGLLAHIGTNTSDLSDLLEDTI